MSSTDRDIRLAYVEDRRNPYYSIQDGRPQRGRWRLCGWRQCSAPGRVDHAGPTREGRPGEGWTWGHFRAALEAALNGERGQAARPLGL